MSDAMMIAMKRSVDVIAPKPEPKRRRLVVQDLRDHLPDDIIGLIVQARVRCAREFNRRSHAARLLQQRWLFQNRMRYVAWDQQMQEEAEEDRAVLFLQQFWRYNTGTGHNLSLSRFR
jgi:hypothetical protein